MLRSSITFLWRVEEFIIDYRLRRCADEEWSLWEWVRSSLGRLRLVSSTTNYGRRPVEPGDRHHPRVPRDAGLIAVNGRFLNWYSVTSWNPQLMHGLWCVGSIGPRVKTLKFALHSAGVGQWSSDPDLQDFSCSNRATFQAQLTWPSRCDVRF